MQHEFDKCEHCGTWHIIKLVDWGGVQIKTCPWIPKDMPVPVRDPDQDNPLSATLRATA
jgi:hypothetical protein